jgi:hypothetical protein
VNAKVMESKKRPAQASVPVHSLASQRHFVKPNQSGERPILAHGDFANAPAEPSWGHDFSRIPVHASTLASNDVEGQAKTESCPLTLATPRVCPFGGACHTCPARIQPKLAISQPGDEYEQEADRVAEQVMRMTEPPGDGERHAFAKSDDRALQRKCAACEEEEEPLRKKESAGESPAAFDHSVDVPPIIHEVLRSPGQPLDPTARAFFELRFGHDFSHVRIHTDAKAAESARAVNALAYTVGSDIVFGPEQHSPSTGEGRCLLAHELVHVVQQLGSAFGASKAISALDRNSEDDAANAAETVTTGSSFRTTESADATKLHRQPPPALGPPAGFAGLTATRVAFNNAGAPEAANCAAAKPAALGVDGPALGQNGMEMIFRINGAIPPGTEFDITRTRATGLWQQDGGAWARLGGNAAGTNDDHHNADECLTPVGGRIFVIDTPGLSGTLDPTGVNFLGAGTVAATATAAVWKLSFAEWVIARNRGLGIGWKRVSTPEFHRWHSIFSVELVGGLWTRVNTPAGDQNEVELGSIGVTGATP